MKYTKHSYKIQGRTRSWEELGKENNIQVVLQIVGFPKPVHFPKWTMVQNAILD
jgi:hypothetical protein